MKMSDRNKLLLEVTDELYSLINKHIAWVEREEKTEFTASEIRDMLKAIVYITGDD